MQYLGFNLSRTPLNDAAVRRAMSGVIDRGTLVSSLLSGHGTAAQLAALDVTVYGKRVTPYGAEALVRRDALPAGAELAPVSIEELFVLMVKGEDVQ